MLIILVYIISFSGRNKNSRRSYNHPSVLNHIPFCFKEAIASSRTHQDQTIKNRKPKYTYPELSIKEVKMSPKNFRADKYERYYESSKNTDPLIFMPCQINYMECKNYNNNFIPQSNSEQQNLRYTTPNIPVSIS